MGLESAAFFAGRKPKLMPTRTETKKARKIEKRVILVCTSVIIEIDTDKNIPRKTPMMPPVILKATASARN